MTVFLMRHGNTNMRSGKLKDCHIQEIQELGSRLIELFPDARFSLFHSGIHRAQLTAEELAKYLPNNTQISVDRQNLGADRERISFFMTTFLI
jgi:broad specificity phosphatase PhoE